MQLPKTPSFRLEGKRALVTGGSRGIGLGAAVALAEMGADLVIAARNKEELDASVLSLRDEGHTAQGAQIDITDTGAVRAFFEAQEPFDILVNSAGLARNHSMMETSEADFDAVFAINVKAAYFLAQQAAIGMRKLGAGSIIQISSQMGHVGGLDRTVYCASKHAIEGLNKAMAIEFGPDKIRCNSICPTFIRTALTAPTFNDPEKVAWVMSKIKLGRVGEISDIMGAVQFLASDAAAMVTGTAILIDGGWTAG